MSKPKSTATSSTTASSQSSAGDNALELKKELEGVLRRVAKAAIRIDWRSTQILPGAGIRKSTSRGMSGFDIATRREYAPGDNPRHIDWKASNRTGDDTMYVTLKQEPRDIDVYVLVDVKATMQFGTNRTLKRTLAAELLASIFRAVQETHDRVGAVVYNQHDLLLQIRPGSPHANRFRALIAVLTAESRSTGAASGLVEALKRLSPTRRALVFVISDFIGLSNEERALLKRTAAVHDLVAVVVEDRREGELPPGTGVYALRDLTTGKEKSIWLSSKTRREFARQWQEHRDALALFFKEAHCTSQTFSTEEGEAALPKMFRLFSSQRGVRR